MKQYLYTWMKTAMTEPDSGVYNAAYAAEMNCEPEAEVKEHFKAGSGEISTVNSIQMGVTFASGNLEPMMMVMVRIKDDVDFIFIAKPKLE